MFIRILSLIAVCGLLLMQTAGQKGTKKGKVPAHPPAAASYKKDIVPIFKAYCLPCHTEDQMNASELYFEGYDQLMKGGKHGTPVIAGNPDSSLLIRKLSPQPPFGDPMPLKAKRPFPEDTLKILRQWITEGAKNN